MNATNEFREVTADELQAVDGGNVTLEDLKSFFQGLSDVLKASSEVTKKIVNNIR